MSSYPEIHLYIGGKWRKTTDTLPVINPSTEQVIGSLPVASQKDLADAVESAREGFKIWRVTSPQRRSQVILKAARLMRERQEEIAQSISLELGKPIRQSRLEVIRGCEFFEWDAGEAQRLYGRVIPSEQGIRYSVVREPVGCVAAFSPWNFPMSQPARKIAGALASGCSLIIKPAEETPAGAIHIAKAFEDAGLPAGVLNVVFGKPQDISSYLIARDETRLVAFTGSTAVGRHLSKLAAEHMTPVLMELGGHAPVIVCEDVDPEEAAVSSSIRKYRNAGQVCTSPTRFFVHETLYESFIRHFIEQTKTLRVGCPLQEETQMGPVAHAGRLQVLQELVDDAVQCGAKLLLGGKSLFKKGHYFAPTLLSDVPDDARVLREEPFGPIAVVKSIKNVEEGITLANSVRFGLSAYGFTHSAANVYALENGIEAGTISINTLEASLPETPFGGVKFSGYGREGGEEGLHHYTNVKSISHSMKIV